jgi:hypothetical protein
MGKLNNTVPMNREIFTPARRRAPTNAKGDSLGKQIGDGVRDVQGAVSTATDVKSAADKAKGLFGL